MTDLIANPPGFLHLEGKGPRHSECRHLFVRGEYIRDHNKDLDLFLMCMCCGKTGNSYADFTNYIELTREDPWVLFESWVLRTPSTVPAEEFVKLHRGSL